MKLIAILTTVFFVFSGAASAQDRNCGDFLNWEDAQRNFQLDGPFDPNDLDRDNDGVACEVLRLAGSWNIRTICRGRDIRARMIVRHIGNTVMRAVITNNFEEASRTRLSMGTNGVVTAVSQWSDGSTTSAQAIMDQDGQALRGVDSLGCEFVAYRN